MNDSGVFDRVRRSDSGPSRYLEPLFAMLNRREGPSWDNVRQLIETWFAAVPPANRLDLRGRLRSTLDKDFRSAFFELYCHEILRRSGWDVEIHPQLAGTVRKPDFAAQRGCEGLYLEATLTAPARDEDAADARLSQLIDGINNGVPIENFMLGVDVIGVGASTPSVTRLAGQLRRWLTGMNPDSQLAREESDGIATWEWHDNDWHLIFEAFPLTRRARGPGGRIVGTFSAEPVGAIDDVTPIRRRIDEKASRYGTALNSALVVGVDAFEPFVNDADVAAALYGRLAVRYYQGGGRNAPPPRTVRGNDGLVWGPRGARRPHMSAVITTTALRPWLVANLEPCWWAHPAADKPLNPIASVFRVVELDRSTNRLHHSPAPTDPATFFNLDADWPHFDP